MLDELSKAQRANLRLDQINGELAELKKSMEKQGDLLANTRVDMAALKTEVWIIGGIIFAAVTALLALFICSIIT